MRVQERQKRGVLGSRGNPEGHCADACGAVLLCTFSKLSVVGPIAAQSRVTHDELASSPENLGARRRGQVATSMQLRDSVTSTSSLSARIIAARLAVLAAGSHVPTRTLVIHGLAEVGYE
jgi:hypothetical protein